MLSISPQPSLLVKMTPGQKRLAMQLGAASVGFSIEPLFSSIGQPAPGIAAAAAQATPQWHLVSATAPGAAVNAWDLCHQLVTQGIGIAGTQVEFAEPDLEQRWVIGSEAEQALALTSSCDSAAPQDSRFPMGREPYWFSDGNHSELAAARLAIGEPDDRVVIAHFDTGYNASHVSLPLHLRTDLQKNFVDPEIHNDAQDTSSGIIKNLGHGTGTLSVLAGKTGRDAGAAPIGGAAHLDVVPIRVANAVVLFKNSSIARAFDYVHLMWGLDTKIAVITMSMGGLASQAWCDGVNALYETGVFIVTAAGNNFGNAPTHNIVFPARFNRVIAACGAMADGKPYTDLPRTEMAGNYGPMQKMATALSGCTPNTPWARFECTEIIDNNGCGTSAATPQVASAAALWIQKYKAEWTAYPEGWMRVEAVRKALFDSASRANLDPDEHLGRGVIRAARALAESPADALALRNNRQPEDSVSFEFLRVLTGLGAAPPSAQDRMLELEALQLTQQSRELEQLLGDPQSPPRDLTPVMRQRIVEAFVSMPGASKALRDRLMANRDTMVVVPPVPHHLSPRERHRLTLAMHPRQALPPARQLRVFAFDPLLGTRLDTVSLNETTLELPWEKDLKPGPIGEYLEVVDVDPSTGACYAPVDLNETLPLSQDGLYPSEANPRFHQQMVYAVAMKTIGHFEHSLGRVALWSPHYVRRKTEQEQEKEEEQFVRRLRIYPHAIREANSFYSPDKKALLFGYFPASRNAPGENLPGGTVFCCLSHDVVAHETTHALLDGLHRYFRESTNRDVLAFHEAFADIVALFQHFTVPEALRDQIARTQGDLARQNMLGELALQFGQAIGNYGALRSAIGSVVEGQWRPAVPTADDYKNADEPHALGAVLVAAVFNAFLDIYKARSADLIRLATGGTGVLPAGAISQDLVSRLADEAAKSAHHVLRICIRALDYCAPVDITFGDYLRALITADRDLVPDDKRSYRAAFINAFRRRGIYPRDVRNLSAESLCWEAPELDFNLDAIVGNAGAAAAGVSFDWDLSSNREQAYRKSRSNAAALHAILQAKLTDEQAEVLGFCRFPRPMKLNGVEGSLGSFEVHSVRPVRRIGPDEQQHLDIVVEITQAWQASHQEEQCFRGGSTLLISPETKAIRYCVRKRVANDARFEEQQKFQLEMTGSYIRSNYFEAVSRGREPFAMMHRGA